MQAQEGERARDQGDGAEAEVECVLCQEQPPQPQPLPGASGTGGAKVDQTVPVQEHHASDDEAGAEQRQHPGGIDDAERHAQPGAGAGAHAEAEARGRPADEAASCAGQDAVASTAESLRASQSHATGAGAFSSSSPGASPAHEAASGRAPQPAAAPDLSGVDVRIKITTLNIQLNKSGGGMMMGWLYRMLLSAFSERIRASVEQAVVHALQVPLMPLPSETLANTPWIHTNTRPCVMTCLRM